MPVAFTKVSTSPLRFERDLGRCIGWACFSKKDGEDYVDLHGDHFPDDELLKAVDGLMKLPIEKREINVEHAGAARGTIVTAFALTEDVAKSVEPKIETNGTYGVLVSFEPDAELKKSIEAGEMVCLSIEGVAHDVEQIAKSADAADIAATKHKRTMRKIELTKLAVCKAGAHEGAQVALLKAARPTDAVIAAVSHLLVKSAPRALAFAHIEFAKRTPAATSLEMGHQHLIHDADEKDGSTSYERADGFPYGHSHAWLKNDDGTITVLAADGHTHTLATEIAAMSNPTDIAKAQADNTALKAELQKSQANLAKAFGLPDDQRAFAKRLAPTELAAFLERSDADRAALATPIHKSRSGRCFYAGEESLAEMSKENDSMAERLEKSEQSAVSATFEKRAEAELPYLLGTTAVRAAILKAVEGIPDEATRKLAVESLVGASQANSSAFRRVGYNGSTAPIVASSNDPEAKLNAIASEIQKAEGGEGKCSFAKAYDLALSRPDGAALYAEIDAANRRAQPSSN